MGTSWIWNIILKKMIVKNDKKMSDSVWNGAKMDILYSYVCLQESRDPRKMYRFFELLLENPICGEGGSFGDTR